MLLVMKYLNNIDIGSEGFFIFNKGLIDFQVLEGFMGSFYLIDVWKEIVL